ncbi:MAG: outer membrane protein [Pedosphaera sp.]|nr:outer membrane protein [Pedosphaera sp.]
MALGTAAAVCLLAAAQIARGAEQQNRGQLSAHDYKFVQEAAEGGMTEVALGQLAADKASDPAVKEFGQRMAQDHSKANQELMQIASQKGAALPTSTTSAEQKEVDRLKGLSGTDFDKAYMKRMVKDHKKDVKEFENAAKKAEDPDLKAFAVKTVPVLQEHLQMAESVHAKVAGEQKQTSAQ